MQSSIQTVPGRKVDGRDVMRERFRAVRSQTLDRAAPLSAEDQALQSMPDASPSKWHQAHTSWFFEALLLQAFRPDYRCHDPRYALLFNSYYEALGPRHPRAQRGLLSRPSLADVQVYRAHVDAAVLGFIDDCDADSWHAALPLLELGLQHEQQHQELILTDMLHAFAANPLLPAYRSEPPAAARPSPSRWLNHPGGTVEIGAGAAGFAFDNERPRHAVLLQPFEIADRLLNCGEFAAFIQDGGYRRPALWLADGWALSQSQGWQAPPYWLVPGDPRAPSADWQVFGLHGVQSLDPAAPVMQLSYYEAAAYAEWAGARLPTEFEWEAAATLPGLRHGFDQAWQWTSSAYQAYPGFRPLAGAAAEYNGKFMVGQMVLRGASLATPQGHSRASYRNFFPPAARWQFSGLRLARDTGPAAIASGGKT